MKTKIKWPKHSAQKQTHKNLNIKDLICQRTNIKNTRWRGHAEPRILSLVIEGSHFIKSLFLKWLVFSVKQWRAVCLVSSFGKALQTNGCDRQRAPFDFQPTLLTTGGHWLYSLFQGFP